MMLYCILWGTLEKQMQKQIQKERHTGGENGGCRGEKTPEYTQFSEHRHTLSLILNEVDEALDELEHSGAGA